MLTRMIYVAIGALGTGLWNVFISAASRQMHPLLGALITEITAFSAGLILFLPLLRQGRPEFSVPAAFLCIGAGLSVLLADFFILKAYKEGLPVSIGGPIIIGGGILVVTFAGLILGDRMSWTKALSILMILCGASILAGQPR